MPKRELVTSLYHELAAVHCRQARAALRWTQAQLAGQAGVSEDTIFNIEREWTETPRLSTRIAVFSSLEHGGIEFVKEQSGRIAVYPRNNG